MLASKDLRFAYSPSVTFQFPDISATPGKPLLILGESGKGKTTLLHLLAGLLAPQKGQIVVGETDITRLATQELDIFRGAHIGLVFQQAHFVGGLSVLDNLRLAQYLARGATDADRGMNLLERLNLAEKARQKPSYLSQGQQQRVAIARALINDPVLILADEPTSSLDDTHCMQVADLLAEQAEAADASLVIVTHDQRLKDRFSYHISLI